MSRTARWATAFVMFATACLHAEDWPQWRGKDRLGVWTETGIVDTFSPGGLKVLWRTSIKAGYSGPVVADGRVFVMDFERVRGLRGKERLLALDERTGKILWTAVWDADFRGGTWVNPPNAIPSVDGDRIYVQGTTGLLLCLKVQTGEIVWQRDYLKEFGANPQIWSGYYGFSTCPLVDGPRLLTMVGGKDNALVVAFDKMTGKEIWRALPRGSRSITEEWGPGVLQFLIVNAGGVRQLIVHHPEAVVSLNPVTGAFYWEQPFAVYSGITVAGPVQSGAQLLFSTPYNGSLMLTLDERKPAATVLWKGKSDSEIQTDTLHSWISVPVVLDGCIFGICSYGQLRCLDARTGARLWETQVVAKERARWTQAFIVRQGRRFFINNDRGELIIARLSRQGYEEISRTELIKPTTAPGNRRERVGVSWTHPAYANRHIYMRNDEEIIAASLEIE